MDDLEFLPGDMWLMKNGCRAWVIYCRFSKGSALALYWNHDGPSMLCLDQMNAAEYLGRTNEIGNGLRFIMGKLTDNPAMTYKP